MGDSIATNASCSALRSRKGIPLSLEAILRAIEINGAAIEMNKQAFTWTARRARPGARSQRHQFRARATTSTRTLDETIAYRANF